MALALNNRKKVDMPLNKEMKPNKIKKLDGGVNWQYNAEDSTMKVIVEEIEKGFSSAVIPKYIYHHVVPGVWNSLTLF